MHLRPCQVAVCSTTITICHTDKIQLLDRQFFFRIHLLSVIKNCCKRIDCTTTIKSSQQQSQYSQKTNATYTNKHYRFKDFYYHSHFHSRSRGETDYLPTNDRRLSAQAATSSRSFKIKILFQDCSWWRGGQAAFQLDIILHSTAAAGGRDLLLSKGAHELKKDIHYIQEVRKHYMWVISLL